MPIISISTETSTGTRSVTLSKFFEINKIEFSAETIAEHKKLQAKFIVPDPSEDLKQIYEVNRLADLIGIRAEKFDSPEFKYLISDDGKYLKNNLANQPCGLRIANCEAVATTLLSGRSPDQSGGKLVPVPKMVQNPNFDQMLLLIKRLRTEKSLRVLKMLVCFLEGLPLPRITAELSTNVNVFRKLYALPSQQRADFDVRYCFKINDIISYLYNQYVSAPTN